MQTYQSILRWLALLPTSIIGATLAYYIVGVLNRITMWASGSNSNSFLTHLLTAFITHAAYGFVFVLVATIIAPGHQKQVGFAMAGFIAICTIGLIYFDTIDGKYWGILGDISTLMGAGGITLDMWAANTWGKRFLNRGPENLSGDIDRGSPTASQ